MKDNNKNNSGFTLPIINLLIIIIVGFGLLFFSETANIGVIILSAIGFFIIIAASSIIIGIYLNRKKLKIASPVSTDIMNFNVIRKPRKIKEYKAWFSSGLSFEELANKLKGIGVIENYLCGYENVYEWIEAEMKSEDLKLNISRKHCRGVGFEIEPIHIRAMYTKNEPDNSVIEEVAEKIATNLKCKVYLGYIEYIQAHEYTYKSTSEIRS